jgi:hypothetical protein
MLAYPNRTVPVQERIHSLLRYHRQRIDWAADTCPHTRAIARIKRTRVYKGYCNAVESAARQRASDRLLSAYA